MQRFPSIINPAAITEVTYTYTDNGKLATLKDARNFTTTYSFDGHDRALRTTYPDSTYEEVSSYDGNSNPLTLRTRSGATVTLTYDELNRVKTKTPTGQPTVTTVYDIAGRVTTVSTPVVAGDPSSGTFTNYYDTAGRFYREQYPDGLSVTHVLDANGNVTKTTYPDGYYVERVYDQMNRQTDIKLNGSVTSAIQFQYDALSRRTKLIYENGCVTNYGFEDDNDLSGILQNFVGSSVAFGYSFDDVGQMVSQRVSDPVNYRWTPGSAGTVAYGAANNMNQYPTVGGTGFTYSTDGNLTNDGVYKYEFNTERMLTRVRNAGTNAIIADYLYDPALRQRQKNVGGTKTNYYYAGWQRLADYDGTTNVLQQRYVYGSGLDEVLIQVTSGGTKTYFHSNHQGSIVAVTDSSGAVVNRFRYGPYGESSALSGTSHGYTGQRYDSETGLYYYKMRHYSPKLGRFLQPDPIGFDGGLNLYSYVSNSGVNSTDTFGLASDSSSGSPLGSFPNGTDPLLGSAPILYYTDRFIDWYASGEASFNSVEFDSLGEVYKPDIAWDRLQGFATVLNSTAWLPLHVLQQYSIWYRHAIAVSLVKNFLVSQGVNPADIFQEVPLSMVIGSRNAIADLVYMKNGVWEMIEVKTTLNTNPDFIPRLSIAQQAVYPAVQNGNWDYSRPKSPSEYGGVLLSAALPARTPVSVRQVTVNYFTDTFAISKIVTKVVGG